MWPVRATWEEGECYVVGPARFMRCGHGRWRKYLGALAPHYTKRKPSLMNNTASRQTEKMMGKRDWVKSLRKKLPDDLGDCPTLPQEMLDLITSEIYPHSLARLMRTQQYR